MRQASGNRKFFPVQKDGSGFLSLAGSDLHRVKINGPDIPICSILASIRRSLSLRLLPSSLLSSCSSSSLSFSLPSPPPAGDPQNRFATSEVRFGSDLHLISNSAFFGGETATNPLDSLSASEASSPSDSLHPSPAPSTGFKPFPLGEYSRTRTLFSNKEEKKLRQLGLLGGEKRAALRQQQWRRWRRWRRWDTPDWFDFLIRIWPMQVTFGEPGSRASMDFLLNMGLGRVLLLRLRPLVLLRREVVNGGGNLSGRLGLEETGFDASFMYESEDSGVGRLEKTN